MCDPRRAASIQLPEIEPPLRRGSGPLDLFAATIPPPFLRPISSEVRTHGRNREGEPVAEISTLSSARMPPCRSREVARQNMVRDPYPGYCHYYDATGRSLVYPRRLSSCARRCARPGSLQHPARDPRAHGHTDNRLKEIKDEEGPAFFVLPADNRRRKCARENTNHSERGAQPA